MRTIIIAIVCIAGIGWLIWYGTRSKEERQLSIIDSKIQEYIRANAHNPDTYEPISTKLMLTTSVINDIIQKINSLKYSVESNNKSIKEYKHMSYMKDLVRSYKEENKINEEKIQRYHAKIDSIKNSPNKNPILSYTYLHQCRINVPLGGKMLKNMTVVTDSNNNILSFTEGDMIEIQNLINQIGGN